MNLDQILKCVNDEKEFPETPQDDIKIWLENVLSSRDMKLLIELLRVTVMITKKNIADRIRREYKW